MPDRLIRARILSSESIDRLSHAAECTFYRLLTVADDWGRLEADIRVVASRAFPLRAIDISRPELEAWLQELVGAGILVRYDIEGKPYAAFLNWTKHNHLRNKMSKFPGPGGSYTDPSNDPNDCERLQTSASDCGQPSAVVGKKPPENARKQPQAIADNCEQTQANAAQVQIEANEGEGEGTNPGSDPILEPPANNCEQLPANAPNPESESESESEVLINTQYLIGGEAAKNAVDAPAASSKIDPVVSGVSPSARGPEPDGLPAGGPVPAEEILRLNRRPGETDAQCRRRLIAEKREQSNVGMTNVGGRAREVVGG